MSNGVDRDRRHPKDSSVEGAAPATAAGGGGAAAAPLTDDIVSASGTRPEGGACSRRFPV